MTAVTNTMERPVSAPRWPLIVVPLLLALGGSLLRVLAYVAVIAPASVRGYVDAMCVWDCYWYGDIVLHGYQAHPEQLNFGGPAGIANWAFFPLYPLLIRAVQQVLALSPQALGMLVSPLLTLAAVLVSWPLFKGDRRGYYLFGALLLAGPFSFYFSILYSESLFLLLTVAGFVLLDRQRYVGAGLVGALLSATRTVGVLFVFAILVEAVRTLWRRPRETLGRPDMIFALMVAPLGLFAFMAWLHHVTGDALAFAHIQRAWDRQAGNPVSFLVGALIEANGQVRDARLLGIASVIGLVLCALLVWKRQYAMAVFCTLALVLALANGVESMIRFVAALAPLGIVLSQVLARWWWSFWLALAGCAVLDVWWTIGWMHQFGALM